MKNNILIGPWRVVPLEEMLFVMEILKEAATTNKAFNLEREPVYIN